MPKGQKTEQVATEARHRFRVMIRRWVGHSRSLVDDREVEFTEFIPFRPRGAQLLLDPFNPVAGDITVTGRALSPARELDPGASLEAWCNGESITVEDGGSFSATTTLHPGTDQVHLRAIDDTKLVGRGFISTWTPHTEAERADVLLDGNTGAYEGDEAPAGVRKPPRYGRTRAEIQRFAIHPALTNHDKIELVLKDDKGSELGRVEVDLEHEGRTRSWTPWVCITATDPRADPELDAIEGRIIRVPSLASTLELVMTTGKTIGHPVRFSGLDPARAPDGILELPDPTAPATLDLMLGGRFGLDGLNLQWMTTADADDVLLPGEGANDASGQLAAAVGQHEDPLGEPDPVDLSAEKVLLPAGWATVELDARESTDPWQHEETVDLLTYQSPPDPDSPESADFVHTARQPRAAWHPSEEWAANPDQVYVKLADGTADADVAQLCRDKGLRIAGTVRRDGHVLLESPEPLDLDELKALVEELAGEGAVEVATMNYIDGAEENVASVRVPDVMRGGAAAAPQPGCYRPYDILTLRHHLQTRAFPAQQIIEHLRLQTTTQSQIRLGITDDGFGNASMANISPDFALPRLPWLGRTPGPGTGAWPSFPANIGATLPFTHPNIIDPGGSGHGTRTLHVMAGGGTRFISLNATTPPLAPAGAPIANYQAQPWCVGVCPAAQVLPMRTIGVAGGTWFSGISAIRFAFLQGCQVVNTSAGLNSTAVVPPAIAAGGWYNVLVTPMLNQARASGGIWVVSGGNRPLPHNIHFHSAIAPTGARAAASNPVVAVTPTSQSLLPTSPLGASFPLSFTNPWHSVETRVLNGWDANSGPESTVSAPGDDLNLRAFSLTAASTTGHLGSGSGTSFAAPQTAGLLGLMKLADQVMGRTTPRPGVATPADAANRLIDLMCFTAHKDQPLFTAGENAAGYSTELGHGRIDCWAAVLSALNGGPMFAGTAPHGNLANTGTYIAPGGASSFYGFELDTSAFHARPLLVNVVTGATERVVDTLALDPAIDSSDPTRPVWSYQARAGGTGDRILPPSAHPGPTPSYLLQFTARGGRLNGFTHLCFELDANEPPIVQTPGTTDLRPGTPNRVFYGLPLAPLLAHSVTGAGIAPFGVDMRHFIFKANTAPHERRLRVTFDCVELHGAVAGDAVDVQWTVAGAASGYRAHPGRTGITVPLASASHAFVHAENAPLSIAFEVRTLGTANVTYQPPATPTSTTFTPWGLGVRKLELPGVFTVFFRVEMEPNLPRQWQVSLTKVLVKDLSPGEYAFAVESGGLRSAWSAPTRLDKLVITDKIQFGYDSADLDPISHATLKKLATTIKANPHIKKIRIDGHTSADGNDAYNLNLSNDRANSVRKHLVDVEGIDGGMLSTRGFGESTPIESNATEEGRVANRRVEFTILERESDAVVVDQEVPITAGSVVALSPFVPNQTYGVAVLAWNLNTMEIFRGNGAPASLAQGAVETLTLSTAPRRVDATIEVRSNVVPQVFV